MATLGQIVHYVIPECMRMRWREDVPPITEIPAIVTWTPGTNSHVSLEIFSSPWALDARWEGTIDVPYSQMKEPETWHYVED